MKYIVIIIQFFKEYWAEVQKCASLTAQLWGELMKLAPKLAARLRDEMK
ncbi:MAG: hypothetical protein KDJ52_00245 [Anaerolineae bacterium]|nr:hypothetical protein [Anaerolineae bacterium]